jgi:hypothetical protein
MYAIVSDVCAFANTNGGTAYIGLPSSKRKKPVGVDNPNGAVKAISQEIESKITPPVKVSIDVQRTGNIKVVRIVVPRGDDPPYAIDDNRIYVRGEAETSLAVRDEIVQLVRRGLGEVKTPTEVADEEETPGDKIDPPRTGVEIIASEKRRGTQYHTMRDLRNGNVVKNVTRKSARRLWHYAITQHEAKDVTPDQIQWTGDIGLWQRRKYRGEIMYDLAQRDNGALRIYYGVTEAGVHGEWQKVIGSEDD